MLNNLCNILAGPFGDMDFPRQLFFKPDFVDIVSEYMSFKESEKERRDSFVKEKQGQKRKMIEVSIQTFFVSLCT